MLTAWVWAATGCYAGSSEGEVICCHLRRGRPSSPATCATYLTATWFTLLPFLTDSITLLRKDKKVLVSKEQVPLYILVRSLCSQSDQLGCCKPADSLKVLNTLNFLSENRGYLDPRGMTHDTMGMWHPPRVNSKKDTAGFLDLFFFFNILHSVAQIVHILYVKHYESFTGLVCVQQHWAPRASEIHSRITKPAKISGWCVI